MCLCTALILLFQQIYFGIPNIYYIQALILSKCLQIILLAIIEI